MDPIADMLTTIRNAQAVKKSSVRIPYSNVKFDLAKLLESEGMVGGVEKTKSKKPSIVIKLKYKEDGSPLINELKKVSKPGQRIYVKYRDLSQVKSEHEKAIISTPEGLLTSTEAKKRKMGGEYICTIW